VPEVGYPETKTPLDGRAGNTRNHDLLVIGKVRGERVVVDVEGKADESFGPTVEQRMRAATTERQRNPRSGALERVRSLCENVLGLPPEEVGEVWYQLVHAMAAAVNAARAKQVGRVAWVVHEFRSRGTNREKLEMNMRDLDAFVARVLGPGVPSVSEGRLIGPIHVGRGGQGEAAVELYIRKAVCELG
jgi:hypothetical protein